MANRPHLVIFDAMNLIRRHYAVHQGQADAILRLQQQTSKQMLDLLDQLKATHVVTVFDGEEPGWRHQLWPAYKSSRSPLPEELAQQLATIQAHWADELGIDSVLPSDDEADDLVATLATKASHHGASVTIISTDQGFYQCLSAQVAQYDVFGRQFLTPEHYLKKFSISAEMWPSYKALVGDSSSDIPGLAGFGPKTAKEFISHQFSEQALAPAKLVTWQQHQEEFLLFRKLMTLDCDRLLGFKLSDLRWTPCP